MPPTSPTTPAAVSSPAATGGAGTYFEQNVGAYWLSLLLVRGIPPILTDCVVVEVSLRSEIITRLAEIDKELSVQIAETHQRVEHLEKLLDEGRMRRWQVWLAFLGAILSATIALIVALVKK